MLAKKLISSFITYYVHFYLDLRSFLYYNKNYLFYHDCTQTLKNFKYFLNANTQYHDIKLLWLYSDSMFIAYIITHYILLIVNIYILIKKNQKFTNLYISFSFFYLMHNFSDPLIGITIHYHI